MQGTIYWEILPYRLFLFSFFLLSVLRLTPVTYMLRFPVTAAEAGNKRRIVYFSQDKIKESFSLLFFCLLCSNYSQDSAVHRFSPVYTQLLSLGII